MEQMPFSLLIRCACLVQVFFAQIQDLHTAQKQHVSTKKAEKCIELFNQTLRPKQTLGDLKYYVFDKH